MPSDSYFSKRHDDGATMVIDFTPPIGVGFNLQEAGLQVWFIARDPEATTPKVRALATVTGPWQVTYKPSSTDTDTIGTYEVECSALRTNGDQITLPTRRADNLTWTIDTDLDNL